MTGHTCKHPILELGEMVACKVAADETQRHKADSEWHDGIVVGAETRNTEFLIVVGTVRFETPYQHVKSVTKERAYQPEVKIDYERYLVDGASTSDPMGIPQEGPDGGVFGNNDPALAKPYYQRSFIITKEDGDKYGFSEVCPGYTWL